jgi:hypothetical protein
MRKIILIASLLLFFAGSSFAQTAKPGKAKTTTKSALAAKATTAAGPTKKDGTADMRYKENKAAAQAKPATTHVKKDGTPDKRYKENKKAG